MLLKNEKEEGADLEFYKVGQTFLHSGSGPNGIRKRGAESWSSNWVAGFIPLNLDACVADDMLIEKMWKKIAASPVEIQIN